jgi:hypothetical protein
MHGDDRWRSTYYECEGYRRPPHPAPGAPPNRIPAGEVAVERVVEFLSTRVFGGRAHGAPAKGALRRPTLRLTRNTTRSSRYDSSSSTLSSGFDGRWLEREDPEGEAAGEIRGRLRELASLKARKQRELEAAERARLRGGRTPKLRSPSSTYSRSWRLMPGCWRRSPSRPRRRTDRRPNPSKQGRGSKSRPVRGVESHDHRLCLGPLPRLPGARPQRASRGRHTGRKGERGAPIRSRP